MPLFIPWLRFSRILQFSSLKPGSFRWVATLCKERDDPQYAWENIKYLFSIKMEISISIFIIMVNFKSSGFNKGTGGKSGKFQFDCDGCIIFVYASYRSINITDSFSFSLYNMPFYTVFHSRAIANITVLLYRSLKFSDRNSNIDCNFGNTWWVFGAKLTDKVARTLFHSLL